MVTRKQWNNTCLFVRYYNCVHGFPHAYECPPPLVFDEAQGTCVREEQASSFAKKCEKSDVKEEIEGINFAKKVSFKKFFLKN